MFQSKNLLGNPFFVRMALKIFFSKINGYEFFLLMKKRPTLMKESLRKSLKPKPTILIMETLWNRVAHIKGLIF